MSALRQQMAAMVSPSTARMDPEERADGVRQMLEDLTMLARRDGCVAAAWALEVLLADKPALSAALDEGYAMAHGVSK